MFNQVSEENVLSNANTAIGKINSDLFDSFQQSTKFGVAFRAKRCSMCKRYLDRNSEEDVLDDKMNVEENFLDDDDELDILGQGQNYKVFACTHTYHIPCIKHYYRKRLPEGQV